MCVFVVTMNYQSFLKKWNLFVYKYFVFIIMQTKIILNEQHRFTDSLNEQHFSHTYLCLYTSWFLEDGDSVSVFSLGTLFTT